MAGILHRHRCCGMAGNRLCGRTVEATGRRLAARHGDAAEPGRSLYHRCPAMPLQILSRTAHPTCGVLCALPDALHDDRCRIPDYRTIGGCHTGSSTPDTFKRDDVASASKVRPQHPSYHHHHPDLPDMPCGYPTDCDGLSCNPSKYHYGIYLKSSLRDSQHPAHTRCNHADPVFHQVAYPAGNGGTVTAASTPSIATCCMARSPARPMPTIWLHRWRPRPPRM